MEFDWKGVFPAVTTQMTESGEIDFDLQAKHLERLIDSGIDGFVMCGSLGENQTIEASEKVAVVKHALEVVGGRLPVLSGVAENSTSAAVRYIQEMERIGASGVMTLPAMIYKADSRETVEYFKTIAKASHLPVLLYNNPIGYGVDITPEMLEQLAELPTLRAIKESCGDPRRITDIINKVGDRFAIFAGVDDLIVECVAVGAVGWIAGVGLAFPEENEKLWNLLMERKWDEALTVYRWFTQLLKLDIGVHFVQKIKLALQEVGLGAEWVRAPRLPLVGKEREDTIAAVQHAVANKPGILR